MKNIFNYKFMTAALSLGLLCSCNDDEATYQKSVKSIVTATQTSFTIAEGDSATVTLNLDTPFKEKCDLKIELISGTGSQDDFTTDGTETAADDGWGLIGYKLAVPAYATAYTFKIKAILDLLPEGTETLKLKLSSAGNGNALVDSASEYITVTINPTVSNDFYAKFDWSGSFKNYHGTTLPGLYVGTDDKDTEHELCGYDFDLEIYDAGFNVVESSYGNCPEDITMSAATTPDGDYLIVPTYYTSVIGTLGSAAEIALRPKSGEIIYPAFLTMSKPGAFVHTVDMTGQFKYSLGGFVQNNPNAIIPVALLTKTGNTYVLTDYNTSEVLAQGRMQSFLNGIRNKKVKK
jgi:hypothetical protein